MLKKGQVYYEFVLNTTIIFLCILMITISIPAPQPPTMEIWMELYSNEEIIDTSPDVTEPEVEVEGLVTLESRTPMHIEVNLTVQNDWNVTIEPANFTLNIQTTGLVTKTIKITVKAPLGIENNTEHLVRIGGTWSYFQGIGGGELEPVTLNLVAQNSSMTSNDNNHANDDEDDENNGVGVLEDFGTILLVAAIAFIIIILIIFVIRRKRNYEE